MDDPTTALPSDRQHERALEALRVSEARYRLLHESMRDAFVQVAMDGRFLECNDQYCELLGYTRDELGALSYQDVTLPRWHGIESEIVRTQVLPRGYSDVYEKEYRRKDGTVVPVELRAVLQRDAEGRPVGMWGLVRDITERKRAESALREEDRRKDEFIAVLSHELRNPLAPLRNAVELLNMQEELPPAVRAARGVIDRQVRHLARLVDDLLEVSRIKQGKLRVQRSAVTLSQVLDSALEAVAPQLAQHVAVTLPAEPVPLHADLTRLSQVFSNLLHNAGKFTPPDGRIDVLAARDGDEVVVRVRDTGAGIPPEQLGTLFELFVQARAGATHASGLGIGLFLARRLVELHGGRVDAHSDGEGRGSEFIVRLPVLAAAPGAGHARLAAARGALAGLCVLVVDDSHDCADTLAALLRTDGAEVGTAYDGHAAVEAATTMRPHAVVLDIGLPGMTGHEACRALRANPATSGVFVVAVSGWGQETDRRRSAEAGFDAHLVKPVDHAELVRLLAMARRTSALPGAPAV